MINIKENTDPLEPIPSGSKNDISTVNKFGATF